MQTPGRPVFSPRLKLIVRTTVGVFIFLLSASTAGVVFLIKTKEIVFDTAGPTAAPLTETVQPPQEEVFPIGVNPFDESITENPEVDAYFDEYIGEGATDQSKLSWFNKAIYKLAKLDWYQNLASPISRILVIRPGERKEEVINNFQIILKWNKEEADRFDALVAGSSPKIDEGKFFPGKYVVTKDASPEEVASMVIESFDKNVASRYSEEISALIPLEDTLTIASLLEREAYDFEDMRFIAGVIWNRLFIDMNLQVDASLQYAKASGKSNVWWPPVRPADKYIDSPFNTYQNEGLPPLPIANPSSIAILAALNPKATECVFYFHDADGGFHCTETYEEHVRMLKEYYGQGK